ncbi:MAG TPA: DUF2461 domain-containing protein [Dehalococcoidia bacterium]|nr:DUF2461 domain-containing protein [Dehalococcoidia bacterium]
MRFDGFAVETFRFLEQLTLHNDKSWFEAHRGDYQAFYLQPALAFIEALGPRLAELPGDIEYEARVNGSLFRINRDIRFSADKTPYKNHIDMWFWQGERKGWDSPGYFMRLLPDEIILGAGMHRLDKAGLVAFRNAVIAEKSGAALEQALARVTDAGPYAIGGEARKRVPKGYDAFHPRARLLLLEGLSATLETPLPTEATSAEFVEYCLDHFRNLSPINQWLSETLEVRPDGV